MSPDALRRRVLLSSTMLMAAIVGYGRRVYAAGGCYHTVGSTYVCSGHIIFGQGITANNGAVSTVPGVSFDDSGIGITGKGALSYIDTNAAPGGTTLDVKSTGNDVGTGSPGSITINTNGTFHGGNYGIYAHNDGSGAITIVATGNVTGEYYAGIRASSFGLGTGLSVTTGAGTSVSGGSSGLNYGPAHIYGIYARNRGGALTITANGNVTGSNIYGTRGDGIHAYNLTNSTDLRVTTAAGTTVSGGSNGIYARNFGTGALTITANGDITGSHGDGIHAFNYGYGTGGLSVSTGAHTTISGGVNGIHALNYEGALTITSNGDVTGTNSSGIYASNRGTDLSVTTAAGTTVHGGNSGIFAHNYGGVLTIIAYGNVTSTSGRGIYARNSGGGTDLNVTTAVGTTVSGGTDGIFGRNDGSGALTIMANGNVTGTSGDGISAQSAGGPLAIVVAATSTVTSAGAAGIETHGAAATVTVAGMLNGGAGGAIKFDQTTAFANRLELVTGAVINGNVLGGTGTDTLGLSGSGSGSFNVAQLSSFEDGQKTGSGTWTLTGTNAGITTFSVATGTLAINGSLSNAAFTVTRATLTGTGTVGNTSINAGGTFRPGSGTAGTLMTVNGTLGFNVASTYVVNVNPATSSSANVSGTATLGGAAVNAIFANGSHISKQYTILTAGSVSGAFGALTNSNLPANFHDTLTYNATHAYLNLIVNFSTPAPGGLNGNQNNVANALTNFFNTNGGIPLLFASLDASGLSQASGEAGADVAQTGIGAVNQFIDAIFDGAFYDGGPGAAAGFAAVDTDEASAQVTSYAAKRNRSQQASEAYAAVTPRDRPAPSFASHWNVWASAYGGNNRVNGDAVVGSSTTSSRLFGAVAGAGYRMTPDTQLGFALGGAGSSFNLDGGFGGGKADIFNAALYAKHTMGAAYLAGLLGYSWQDTTTDRTLTISGTDQLHAAFKAQAVSARLEGGWRYATAMVGVTPYAALQSISFHLPGYGESATSGASTFALSYASKTVTATRNELGAKFDKAMVVQGGLFTLKAKAAWAYDWNTDRAATATFQALPGATFTVNGAQPSANAALASLGAEMKWQNGWSLAGSFDGEFSRTTASYTGKGSLKYGW
jgi:uncharacterized protein with beta-barrel porin domain